jgi:beta-aspartyl-peptidase (threonine type)
MAAAARRRYEQGLERALEAGAAVLGRGGASLDAVCAAVVELEDSPLFNAGRGAVYNAAGRHELDAAVMDGAARRAGAVAGVSRIRNPVLAARAVMEKTRHVLLVGRGAEAFARTQGLSLVRPSYFDTRGRLLALRRNLKHHHGTVGAVARDKGGNLAAATSTGGYTGKLPGRVGDSPIVGAGTYAEMPPARCRARGSAKRSSAPWSPMTSRRGCATRAKASAARRARRSRASRGWAATAA